MNEALRVPSLVPGRWVYLRSWSCFPNVAYRSNGCLVHAVASTTLGWRVQIEGLTPVYFASPGSIQDGIELVDAHLVSLGAEVVPEAEWPNGCVDVGTREHDRTPFRSADWDAADLAMKARGYSGITDMNCREVTP